MYANQYGSVDEAVRGKNGDAHTFVAEYMLWA
jgi:hypothetical protein